MSQPGPFLPGCAKIAAPMESLRPVRRRAAYRVGSLAAAVAIVVLAVLAWSWHEGREAAPAARQSGAIAVRAVAASRKDVPRYLSTVGTVQGSSKVTIRTRVDGEIRRIAFQEGQEVGQGDVLVNLDARPFEAQLRSAQAQADKDRAQLDNAKRDLVRYEALAAKGLSPDQAVDTTRALVRQFEASVAIDMAQADAARLQVQYATIRAPIGGRLGERLVDIGNIVHPGDASGLVVLTQIRPAAVTFSVPQGALPALRAAMAQGKVAVTALSQDGGRALDEGALTLVDNQVDSATGTVRCKAIFPNTAESMWPGEFVTARTQLGTFLQAVVVPSAAVQNGPDGAFVYVVADGKAKLRPVTVAATMAQSAVIERGVAEGERVVTEGQFQIEPDAPVAIRP
jgi:multidrug efflux system membrane fusion protein